MTQFLVLNFLWFAWSLTCRKGAFGGMICLCKLSEIPLCLSQDADLHDLLHTSFIPHRLGQENYLYRHSNCAADPDRRYKYTGSQIHDRISMQRQHQLQFHIFEQLRKSNCSRNVSPLPCGCA
eukprot:6183057-Pleurochrysis_carterae.AAC.2